jgi:sugar O-acyltransferase (sialic acid O-acetyltransferase NeuD family)
MENQIEIVLIGYSGHGYVCIDIALKLGIKIKGYCEVDSKQINPYQIDYLGNEDFLCQSESLFVSIGDNKIRQKVYHKMKSLNFNFQTLIHPSAIISTNSIIGENTLVSANAVINPMVKIGIGSIINSGAIIEHDCEIGDFAHIAPGAILAGNVKIGEMTFVGANASVKQGVSICNNVIIGIGSVVIKNIDIPGVYIGNPAKKLNKHT